MKQYVLTTTSESGDHYIYFIEHTKMPTDKQLEKFLKIHANYIDEEEGEVYESVDECVEIIDFKKIP